MLHESNIRINLIISQQDGLNDDLSNIQSVFIYYFKFDFIEFFKCFNEVMEGKNESICGCGVRFAVLYGVKGSTAHAWLSGKHMPDPIKARSMGMRYGVEFDWLYFFRGPKHKHATQNLDSVRPVSSINDDCLPGYVRLELLDVEVSAGQGREIKDHVETVAFLDVTEIWARTHLPAPVDRIRVITACGDSMVPDISNGDVLFVDESVRHLDGAGIFVLIWQGCALVKRLQPLMDGRLAIRSSNPAYETEYVTAKQADELQIRGRVLAAWTLKRY